MACPHDLPAFMILRNTVVALKIRHYTVTFFVLVLLEQKMILCVSTGNVYWKANAIPGAAEVCFKFCPCDHKVLQYERSHIKE